MADHPPTQTLVLEVLAARYRLGENGWTFPSTLRPALEALAVKGLVWWKNWTIEKTCLAVLTDAGRAEVLLDGYVSQEARNYQDLLASISLYIHWRYVTRQLSTEQKELFADAIDAFHARHRDELGESLPADRWWRPGASPEGSARD